VTNSPIHRYFNLCWQGQDITAISKSSTTDIELGMCRHWSDEMPYRSLVAVGIQPAHGTILFQVAGDSKAPQNAINALKTALAKHGGRCFYCKKSKADEVSIGLTIDHVEPQSLGGNSELTNLVVACKPCNAKKGHTLIDAFNPVATEEWLRSLARQIEQRFEKLKVNQESSPPQPSQGAASGP
jgi:hypothetical protein